jgi:hypothetical protein
MDYKPGHTILLQHVSYCLSLGIAPNMGHMYVQIYW